ncbi:MAG: TRAP transporter small permease subunit [Thermodesulfobacteriota bacterium]
MDFEVIMRYIFNDPTSWAGDVDSMIFTGAAMIAGAYALLHQIHVRLDLFYRNFSPRRKAFVEILSFPFVLTALAVVLWQGLDMAWWSISTGENAYSQWAPALWPVKVCLPLAALLMILQAFSTYGRIALSLLYPADRGAEEKP